MQVLLLNLQLCKLHMASTSSKNLHIETATPEYMLFSFSIKQAEDAYFNSKMKEPLHHSTLQLETRFDIWKFEISLPVL